MNANTAKTISLISTMVMGGDAASNRGAGKARQPAQMRGRLPTLGHLGHLGSLARHSVHRGSEGLTDTSKRREAGKMAIKVSTLFELTPRSWTASVCA